jgi:hypothetical protein
MPKAVGGGVAAVLVRPVPDQAVGAGGVDVAGPAVDRHRRLVVVELVGAGQRVLQVGLETFLHDGGNRWDHRIASVMTADAVTAALAHTNRPVRLVGATTGATAQISLQAHSTGQPQEWTALSPIAEDALPRLRRHTRHCGAEVRLSMAGAETSLWFRLPRPATGIRRLRRPSSAALTSSLIPGQRVGPPANAPATRHHGRSRARRRFGPTGG